LRSVSCSVVSHVRLPSCPTRRSSDLLIAVAEQPATVGFHQGPGEHLAKLLALLGGGLAPVLAHHVEGNPVEIHHRPQIRRQAVRSEEHTSELQSRENLLCRLLLGKTT